MGTALILKLIFAEAICFALGVILVALVWVVKEIVKVEIAIKKEKAFQAKLDRLEKEYLAKNVAKIEKE